MSRDPSLVGRPRCHVLPPHLLVNIARSGNERQRDRALRSLQLDGSFRNARTGRSALLRSLGPGPSLGVFEAWSGAPSPKRVISTARHHQRLPGSRVRSEGEPASGDVAVDEAYTYMGDTFDCYLDAFGRNSVDDAGMPLAGTVHFSQQYDNAFWDGTQMVYGDGDGEQFDRFTKCVDVIGHELTHGVTESTAGLVYWGQTGALNESVSDVFGSLVKQYVRGEKAEDADWLIGEGLFVPGSVQGTALRSMKAPGTAYDDPVLGRDPQPATMADYDRSFSDNGGVHVNSGIPNHAFYLAATDVGGYAWQTVGPVWYRALLSPLLRPTARFSDFAQVTVLQAQQLYGRGSDEARAVGDAWKQVGVQV